MLCVIPIFSGDVARAKNLLAWMVELGGCHGHRALITADAGTAYGDVLDLRELASQSFDGVDITTNPEPIPDYRRGPSSLLKAAATWAKEHKAGPWLMCEPDSVPLKQGWLEAIAAANKGHENRVMGYRYTAHDPRFQECDGKPMMSGVAVYPEDAVDHLVFKDGQAWDVTNREWMAEGGHHTPLIKHYYGRKELPPTFVTTRKPDDPAHWITIDQTDFFPKEAVLFHRCKDGSLIRVLRRAMSLTEPKSKELVIVLPCCGKDAHLMLKMLTWTAKLCGNKMDRTAVLHIDANVNQSIRSSIQEAAGRAYNQVVLSVYPTPRPPHVGWPAAPNFVFHSVCSFLKGNFNQSWLFMEPDSVPLKPDWLQQIEAEYIRGGKPFMGTVFQGNTHMNGVGVYPHDAVQYVPLIAQVVREAWDFKCGKQMLPHAHNANHLIQHNDNAFSTGPRTFTPSNLNYIHPTTVLYHPNKDGSLINVLSLPR